MGQTAFHEKEDVPKTTSIIAKISFKYPLLYKGQYQITVIEKSTKKEIGDTYIIMNSEKYSENTFSILFDHDKWPLVKNINDITFIVINSNDELITFNGKDATISFTKKMRE